MPPRRPRQRLKKPQIDVSTVEKKERFNLWEERQISHVWKISECVEFNYPFSLSVFYSWGWCFFFLLKSRSGPGMGLSTHNIAPHHIFSRQVKHIIIWQCNSNFYNFYLNRGKSRSSHMAREVSVFSYVFNFITFMKLICNVNWSW